MEKMIVHRKDFTKQVLDDDPPNFDVDDSIQAEAKADYLAGRTIYVGVKAVVSLQIQLSPGAYIVHDVESPGLWSIGVKDVSDPYLNEVFREECGVLEHMLTVMGMKVED